MSVRLGLVGYGKGGRQFHAPLIAHAQGCELTAVVTRSPQRREQLAVDHPGVVAFDDLGSMVASGLVDAVTVTTTADSHVALVLEALVLGLPVVCDKPFALDSAGAQECVDAAEKASVPLSVYQNRRWDSDVLSVRSALESGRLGTLQRIESRIEQFAPPTGIPDSGGGVLLDLGSHLVDQVLDLAGPATSVYAEVDHAGADPAQPVCRFTLSVRHASGVSSLVVGDLAVHGRPGTRFRVFGTAGTLEVPAFDGQADVLMAGGTPAQEGWGQVPAESFPTLNSGTGSERVPGTAGDWREFYRGFARAVAEGAPVPVDPRDSVAGLLLLEAAQRSADTGEVVRL